MAVYPVTELIGKTLYVKSGQTVQVFKKINATAGTATWAYDAEQKRQSGKIGTVYSWFELSSGVPANMVGLWLALEPSGAYLCKFNKTKMKEPAGMRTTAEIEAQKERDEKEAEKERDKANETFGDKALRYLKTATFIAAGAYVVIKLSGAAINKNKLPAN